MQKLSHLIFLLSVSKLASGITLLPDPLDLVVEHTDTIAHVRVTQGRALLFREDKFERVYPVWEFIRSKYSKR